MKFMKYSSIENSYRKKFIDIVKTYHGKEEYICQEKIHGANFSVWMTPDEVKFAKRSGFIKEGENFYNHKEVYKRNKVAFGKLFEAVVTKYKTNEFVVYGEICGGSYPHPDIERVATAKKVQKGISYSQNNEFAGFDIKIDGEFLPVLEADKLMRDAGLLVAPIIAKGNIYDCLAFNTEFNSMLPTQLLLPTLEKNIVEGIVIKPNEAKYLPNGNRVIIKKKNEKFSEKEKKEDIPLTLEQLKELEVVRTIFNEVAPYITENRLRNVISKIGTVTPKDFGKLLGGLNKDVLEDFNKDSDLLINVEKDVKRKVNKMVNGASAKIIRDNLMNIVDGEF
jgi:Rnl2 family RNA ligase